ncbi:MAG TPA: preprotein translocase subunit SecA [bacterium]|nr:preprotein translocase subunit SecA [bacterium]
MFMWLLKHTIGTKNDRDIRRLRPLVARINEIEKEYQSLSDDELRGKTEEFRKRLAAGETTDDLLPEAFAAVKNVCRRLLGKRWEVSGQEIEWDMVPFDVQLIGGIVLHQGKIAEMATGEGKTLVATMPLYLNALAGKNVHLVTVNDYLARRDSEWMGQVYGALGLTVGCIQHDMPHDARREAYRRDITYGTNSEFGFDYLRDNGMAMSLEEQVQRGHHFAIVDEVDSILIDEARTPLIISGPAVVSSQQYDALKPRAEALVRKQGVLCNRLVNEAREEIGVSEKEYEAARKVWLVSKGAPKNRQLLKLMEEPKVRKLVDRVDLDFRVDLKKEERFKFLEELYYEIDEKGHDIDIKEKGHQVLDPSGQQAFVMPDVITATQMIEEDASLSPEEKARRVGRLQQRQIEIGEKLHSLTQLIRAYALYEKDVEYVVQDNRVIIVDEFTGRLMPGRRWSDGLHQAVEAKEGVKVEQETQTFATITIQNYFRLYAKLAGMTGTAETEAPEFHQIYKLDVVVVPTNEAVRRKDFHDVIYKTRREKYNAVVDEIEKFNKAGRPVLVGTVSVDQSEVLSRLLQRRGIPHAVLNARYHAQEAAIVSKAGQRGAVTIATNMAGRGTDIKLGEGVVNADCQRADGRWCCVRCPKERQCRRLPKPLCGKPGRMSACWDDPPCGLHIIGTERHEARRIDRQLRGRSARQGDPGSSRFYLSLEDDLMRLFGSERIARVMERIGMKEGEELVHPLLTRSIETAQKRVEQRNFSIRKHTLEYDDVMNKQREVIYDFRNQVLATEDPRTMVRDLIRELVEQKVAFHLPAEADRDAWGIDGLVHWLNFTFPVFLQGSDLDTDGATPETVAAAVLARIDEAFSRKAGFEDEAARRMDREAGGEGGEPGMQRPCRLLMLSVVDRLWKEHLYNMDALREGIFLRAYGQKDPLIEYKKEGFEMFSEMMGAINEGIVGGIFRTTFSPQTIRQILAEPAQQTYVHREVSAFQMAAGEVPEPALAGAAAHHEQSYGALGGDDAPRPARKPFVRKDRKVSPNEPCPCGSGKKHKKCCGAGKA